MAVNESLLDLSERDRCLGLVFWLDSWRILRIDLSVADDKGDWFNARRHAKQLLVKQHQRLFDTAFETFSDGRRSRLQVVFVATSTVSKIDSKPVPALFQRCHRVPPPRSKGVRQSTHSQRKRDEVPNLSPTRGRECKKGLRLIDVNPYAA